MPHWPVPSQTWRSLPVQRFAPGTHATHALPPSINDVAQRGPHIATVVAETLSGPHWRRSPAASQTTFPAWATHAAIAAAQSTLAGLVEAVCGFDESQRVPGSQLALVTHFPATQLSSSGEAPCGEQR